MKPTDRTYFKQIVGSFAALGIDPPEPVDSCYQATARLADQVRRLGSPQDAIGVAVAAAIDGKRDPAADPDVQRALTASQIANQGIMQQVDAIAYERFRDVCTEHADQGVTAWRKPFDSAVARPVRTNRSARS